MGRYVLLCDEEVHILRAAEYRLSRAGYFVECVMDGEEAWESIQERRPDLVVTEVQVPRLSGLALVKRIREHKPTRELPVLLLTHQGYEFLEREIRGLAHVRVLAKPVSPQQLLQVVIETVDASQIGPGEIGPVPA